MIGDVIARFVRSDGEEYVIGDGEWRIPNEGLENWANVPIQVSSVEIPSYHGALITSKRVNSIDRTITAIASNPSENRRMRDEALSFFNPMYSFECYLTYLGKTRWCEGELYGFKASEGNIYEGVEIIVTILCPNPFLKSVENFGKDAAEVIGMFGFPYMSLLPASEGSIEGYNTGFITGFREFAWTVELDNDGDVESGMYLRLFSTGECVEPFIEVGGKTVKLNTTLRVNDEIEIDTSVRPPTLKLNGSYAMHLVDRTSDLLDIKVPPNGTVVGFGAKEGRDHLHMYIEFYKQYLGV